MNVGDSSAPGESPSPSLRESPLVSALVALNAPEERSDPVFIAISARLACEKRGRGKIFLPCRCDGSGFRSSVSPGDRLWISVDAPDDAHLYVVGSFFLDWYRVLWHSGPTSGPLSTGLGPVGTSTRTQDIILPERYSVTGVSVVASRQPIALLERLPAVDSTCHGSESEQLCRLLSSEALGSPTCETGNATHLTVNHRRLLADSAANAGASPVSLMFMLPAPDDVERTCHPNVHPLGVH